MISEKELRNYIANLQILHDAPCDHPSGIVHSIECTLRKMHISQTLQIMKDILDPPHQMILAMENTAKAASEVKEKTKKKPRKKEKKDGKDYPNIRGTEPSAN